MDIEKLMLPIAEFTEYGEVCFAHLSENGERKETLREHTELCQKYWKEIVKRKKIDEIFQEFENVYLEELSKESRNLFELMTVNIVTVHDLGKINPNFQSDKMHHKWHEEAKPDPNIGSRHSILSSVFYLDYFLGKINEMWEEKQLIEKSEAEILKDFAYIYSYIISRHHGELKKFETYMASLTGKQMEGENLGKRAKSWYMMWKENILHESGMSKMRKDWKKMFGRMQKEDVKKTVYLYGLMKLSYSLLVAADYYATTEFMNGARMQDFGEIVDYEDMIDIYESGDVQKKIREYEKETYPMEKEKLEKIDEINVLRTEMFLDAERILKQNSDQTFYYLEAPTGSGKSNTAMNLGFRLIRENEKLNKIFYIYPFNTLVEQNMESIGKIFGENERVMSQVAVVNSLVPMKDRDEGNDWNRILLDRQFLNYPIILSTHVMLFRTMFGHAKEDVFGFHQLSHSVIILDEIQSYKNELWGEIITFLKGFAELMQMKIIIMSATLPNLDILTDNHCQTIRLIENREKYFNHPKFARRVVADYSLLEQKMTMEYLTDEIVKKAGKNKKVLIEFIRKRSAEECYRILCEKSEIPVFLMTGDSSILDRKRMIRKIEALDSVILVATQVVEAGVDIDMDIGYKDISRLDSEEQFMGRINRSGRKSGIVYFFDLDNAEKIYSGDKRIEKDKTLVNKEMRELLTAKNFPAYYENGILPLVLAEKKKCNDENIEDFFQKTVGNLDMPKVDKWMQLINDNRLMKSVYLGRIIQEENGEEIDGRFVWDEYKQLIEETEMEYSERKVKLHNVRSKMNAFIYQFSCKAEFMEDEQIGELYYIENGEAYFDENDILRRELFEEGKDLFI